MNKFFDSGLDKFSTGDIDWINDDIKVSLISSTVITPDPLSDEFYSDISASVKTTALISGRSTDGRGVMDGDDTTLPGVTDTDLGDMLVIWKDTGVSTASPLIALITDMQGLPVLLNGNSIAIQWSDEVNKILSLLNRS